MEMVKIESSMMAPKTKQAPTSPEPKKVDDEGRAPVTSASADQAQEMSAVQQQAQPVTSAQEGTVEQSLTQESIQQEVMQINAMLDDVGHHEVRFSMSEETGDVVVQIISSESDEIIRQIPPEEVIRLRESLAEMKGILINKQG